MYTPIVTIPEETQQVYEKQRETLEACFGDKLSIEQATQLHEFCGGVVMHPSLHPYDFNTLFDYAQSRLKPGDEFFSKIVDLYTSVRESSEKLVINLSE
ncbi:MAG: hypothetical protein U9R08_06250 [Nanoarchaeota archaeon]|nr:hypothetical protein [Nanoarchaeota archaeon]